MKYKIPSRILAFIAAFPILISASVLAQEPKNRTCILGDLAFFNGRDGRSAYVAVGGIVYDVSGSKEWKNGIHADSYHAGTDLTIQIGSAPHGKEVLQRFPQGGIFVTNKKWVPGFLASLLEQYPILRRHPHPFFVHFPMAFLVAGAIFLILHLYYKSNPFPFEKMAFVMLIFGVVLTPPAIASGLWSWWVVYSLQMLPQVFYKILLSIILFVTEVVCLLLRIQRPFERTLRGWTYFGLMLFLAAAILAIGFFGGELTYG